MFDHLLTLYNHYEDLIITSAFYPHDQVLIPFVERLYFTINTHFPIVQNLIIPANLIDRKPSYEVLSITNKNEVSVYISEHVLSHKTIKQIITSNHKKYMIEWQKHIAMYRRFALSY